MAEITNNPTGNVADILLEKHLIQTEDVKKAEELAAKKGAFLEDAFYALNIVNEEELARTVGEVYNLPYIDLVNKKIPFIVISKFPEDVARKYNIVVFETISDKMIKVALGKPWDPVTRKALDFIRTRNQINIEPYVVTQSGLLKALEQYKNPVMVEKETGSEEQVIADKEMVKPVGEKRGEETEAKEEERLEAEVSELSDLAKEDITTAEQLQDIINNSAIPRVVAAVIKYGVFAKASDIHVEPMEGEETRIRYRIDGILHSLVKISPRDHSAFVARIKILAKLKIDEQRIPQDGRIDIFFGEKEIDLRVSTFPTINGEKVVMRILDKTGGVVKIEDIGLVGKPLKLFMEAIQ
ncbi:MAG: ATPase, T2SS/T4P/T4SS family, partial [Patescibacteria group bacterium]|nr:ATPase, T2SS/T4P/T4SS family [Patescibacteria group bacterium]